MCVTGLPCELSLWGGVACELNVVGWGCRLVEDTAWHPVSKEELDQWKGTFKGWLFKTFLGSPLKSWASVGHWLIWHFDLTKYTDKQQDRVSKLPALWLFPWFKAQRNDGDHTSCTVDVVNASHLL